MVLLSSTPQDSTSWASTLTRGSFGGGLREGGGTRQPPARRASSDRRDTRRDRRNVRRGGVLVEAIAAPVHLGDGVVQKRVFDPEPSDVVGRQSRDVDLLLGGREAREADPRDAARALVEGDAAGAGEGGGGEGVFRERRTGDTRGEDTPLECVLNGGVDLRRVAPHACCLPTMCALWVGVISGGRGVRRVWMIMCHVVFTETCILSVSLSIILAFSLGF